ncbi:hypothetical protein QBC44DRAFT_317218 [Cladorrhinum sp. PSN332]|nr:hypothetical protein QBC44DRAFT_317218 [Cladorrhinum sp. PSN332]
MGRRLDLTTVVGLAALPALAAATLFNPGNICETLNTNLPGLVTFPNTTLYDQESQYWSARQSEVRPACYVTPKTAQHVSKAVKVLVSRNAPFTVKGGGHTGYTGGSNIQDGVTVDLLYLNQVKVSADRKTVSVGPGNRWVDVAEVLDPLGLAVVGGRSSTVGVSGLLLGGGISYFTGIYGWACDNVKLYEVVTSSGDIVTATSTNQHKDLFWALRGGGGSNFGIVTRFDLKSFDQGQLWASSLILPGSMNATYIDILQNYAVNTNTQDPAAHQYFVMTHYPEMGGFLVLSDQFHPSAQTIPQPFRPLHDVPPQAVYLNNTRFSNVTQLTRDIESPKGSRQNFAVTSVKATDAQLLKEYVELWKGFVERIISIAGGSRLRPIFVLQPVPVSVIQLMQQNGGNALGLKPSDGPLFLVQISWEWEDPSLDAVLEADSNKMIDEFDRLAKERGLWNGFVYMNYASRLQDVYKSYGVVSWARLKLTAVRYDPLGRFKRLWKGYYTL